MAPGSSYEQALNICLGQLLRQLGLQAISENTQSGSSKRIDVDVIFKSHRVALEAEIDSRRGALNDARKREGEAKAGLVTADKFLAINYPSGLREEDFTINTEIEWAILPPPSDTPVWISGNAWNLAGVLKRTEPSNSNPDVIAQTLENTLSQASDTLSSGQRKVLAAAIGIDTTTAKAKIILAGAKRSLLILAAAAMFHTRLDDYFAESSQPTLDAYTGQPYQGKWPPTRLQHCIDIDDTVGELEKAWRVILAVDYRPIFEAALRLLREPSQDSNWDSCITLIINRALSVARSAASTRHDLMGRIFHRLLDTARHDGSYYTSTSASVLLAGLAINKNTLPDNLSNFKLLDPACGTGTLLMAAAERIRDLRGHETLDADSVILIEEVIGGLDVNTTACHMTATTLGLLSPSTAFSHMNVRLMPLGIDANNDIRVGSLELLAHKKDASKLDLDIDWASGVQIESEDKAEIAANSQSLVIMNPPYTRDSLRHDQFSLLIEKKLKLQEKKLMDGRAGHGSSSGTMFIDLGEHLVSLEDGATLAIVAPSAMAGAPSALKARKLLAQWFHIEWVIAAHDPQRFSFSENTTISEILIVCRRNSFEKNQCPSTKFVTLRQNPKEAVDAATLLFTIENGTLPEQVGDIGEWPAELMCEGVWRPLGFTSAHLTQIFKDINSGKMFATQRLDEQWVIGPAGRRTMDVFTKHEYSDSLGRRALWHNNTSQTRTMAAKTDVYIHAKTDSRSQRLATSYWNQRGRLLISVSPRLSTARVGCVRLSEPTLGSHWVPARLASNSNPVERDKIEKAMCVWLNSTLGWITLIGVANSNTLQRPKLSLDAMRKLPVPILTNDNITALADAFDKHTHTVPYPLSAANIDPYREHIDTVIATELKIHTELLTSARRELAAEPSTQ